jgi:hypothetical protein
MNLPDAPIAQEGLSATPFFTVRDQEKSTVWNVEFLGGKIDQARKSQLHQAGEYVDHSQLRRWPTPDKPE